MTTGKSIIGALNYNEKKVATGDATCIAANLFGRDIAELTSSEKRHRFESQMNRNRKSKTNVVHVSLNFAVGEKLDREALRQIAEAYMEKIGFGNQPYLVYQHFDSAHPHLHIVSTSIQENGKRIPLHNIGRNQSENARKQIEENFNLIKAEVTEKANELFADPRLLRKAVYGREETKRAISRIVNTVVRSYKYTSLPELNAVLQQFNVVADRGNEGTTMHAKGGLLYSLLDERGNKVGVPIKASRIVGKPILKKLQGQFKLNEALRAPFKKNLQDKIDLVFAYDPRPAIKHFVKALERESIKAVFRQNEEGKVYGITFVDNLNRVVFNGSDLGKQYAAKAIMDRLIEIPENKSLNEANAKPSGSFATHLLLSNQSSLDLAKPISDLLTADHTKQGIDPALTRKKRKKRRRRSI